MGPRPKVCRLAGSSSAPPLALLIILTHSLLQASEYRSQARAATSLGSPASHQWHSWDQAQPRRAAAPRRGYPRRSGYDIDDYPAPELTGVESCGTVPIYQKQYQTSLHQPDAQAASNYGGGSQVADPIFDYENEYRKKWKERYPNQPQDIELPFPDIPPPGPEIPGPDLTPPRPGLDLTPPRPGLELTPPRPGAEIGAGGARPPRPRPWRPPNPGPGSRPGPRPGSRPGSRPGPRPGGFNNWGWGNIDISKLFPGQEEISKRLDKLKEILELVSKIINLLSPGTSPGTSPGPSPDPGLIPGPSPDPGFIPGPPPNPGPITIPNPSPPVNIPELPMPSIPVPPGPGPKPPTSAPATSRPVADTTTDPNKPIVISRSGTQERGATSPSFNADGGHEDDDYDEDFEDVDDERQDDDFRIFKGQDAVPNEWPWIVHLKWADKACSGSIISSRWILSAGHCGYNASMRDYSATTNEYKMYASGRMYRIDRIFVHPLYSPKSLNHDIALFHTDRDIVWDEHTRPVCLIGPSVHDVVDWSMGKKCFVIGYGLVDGFRAPKTLQKLNIEPRSYSQCEKARLSMSAGSVCIGPAGSTHTGSTCQGDSGGPNVCYDEARGHWEIFGVVSYGPQRCGAGSDGRWLSGAADVTNYRKWILQTIALPGQ